MHKTVLIVGYGGHPICGISCTGGLVAWSHGYL